MWERGFEGLFGLITTDELDKRQILDGFNQDQIRYISGVLYAIMNEIGGESKWRKIYVEYEEVNIGFTLI